MEPRMKNPAALLPGATEAVQSLYGMIFTTGIPPATVGLVHLRASQINGCAPCVIGGTGHMRKAGETEDRISAVAVWRDAPYFTDAERAALDLAEAMTRLSDRPDPVPDDIWNEAAEHYDEKALAGLVLAVGMTNLFNRFNVTTRQLPGAW